MTLLQLAFLLLCIKLTSGVVCSKTTIGVADPPNNYNGNLQTSTGRAYVMTDGTVQFTCCGVIKGWRFYVSNPGTIKLQVWRGESGTTFKLVAENSFTVPNIPSGSFQLVKFEVPPDQRIAFIENDYIGWYTSGSEMIPYSTASPAPDKTYFYTAAVTTGNSYTFTNTNYYDNRNFAIVADVDANVRPYFSNLPSKVHVFDHLAVGDLILTLDPRDTINDDITVTLNSASSYFTLDSTTYELTVSSSLSQTTSLQHVISPKIVDSCSQNTIEPVTIFIKNQQCIINSLPSSATIDETETTETLLHTMTVTDGETITCSLQGVQPTTTVFQVKETTPGSSVYGIYYVPVSGTGFDFDYDTTVRYDVTVTCTDGRLPSAAGHLMVYILKNKPPEFTNLPADVTYPQQTTDTGTTFPVLVTDIDSITLTYSIVCEPVTSCPYTITSGGIVTTTVDLSTIQVPGYDVKVTVNDGHTSVGPYILSTHISNINDIPVFANTPPNTKIGVEENMPTGTILYTFSSTDLDRGVIDNVQYTMAAITAGADTYFELGATDGQLTTKVVIDFDVLTTTSYVIRVEVTDTKDTSTTTVTVSIVNVNEAPSFTGSNYIIADDEDVGQTHLATASIAATDPDAGDTANLKFTMDCNGYNTTYFEMDEANGEVYFGRDFDSDVGHPPVTECNVTVTDTGGLTAVEFLTINIADTNDFTPTFDHEVYTAFLFPDEAIGTILVNVSASDGDISTTWNTIIYAIDQSGLGDDYFEIDVNGSISVAKDISAVFKYGQTLSLPLTATDGGRRQGTATLSLIFPETTTTSTTTTERPFVVQTYGDNGYWYSLAAVVVLLNVGMMMFLCYRYCSCKCLTTDPTEAQLKAERIKEMKRRKALAAIKFLPSNDPWSVHLHSNYSKPDKDKKKEMAASQKIEDEPNIVRSSSSSHNVKSSTSVTSSYSNPATNSDVFVENKNRDQTHHIYNPNTAKKPSAQRELW